MLFDYNHKQSLFNISSIASRFLATTCLASRKVMKNMAQQVNEGIGIDNPLDLTILSFDLLTFI
jgi:hypothetical protein